MGDEIGLRFWMNNGDGDRRYFDSPMTLKTVKAVSIGDGSDERDALLLIAEDGPFAGEYFAITSRLTDSIQAQLGYREWISVVVHKLNGHIDDLPEVIERSNVNSFGMTALLALRERPGRSP